MLARYLPQLLADLNCRTMGIILLEPDQRGRESLTDFCTEFRGMISPGLEGGLPRVRFKMVLDDRYFPNLERWLKEISEGQRGNSHSQEAEKLLILLQRARGSMLFTHDLLCETYRLISAISPA